MTTGGSALLGLAHNNECMAFLHPDTNASIYSELPVGHPGTSAILRFYDLQNKPTWVKLFDDLTEESDRFDRLREYIHDGDVELYKIIKSPFGRMTKITFDGSQLDIRRIGTESVYTNCKRYLPSTMLWSNMIRT